MAVSLHISLAVDDQDFHPDLLLPPSANTLLWGYKAVRIKRYLIASGKDPELLQNEVSKLLAEGWQPFGQMTVAETATGSGERFFQPMVQFEGEIRS
jgi:hypothetical protein